jgi:TonB family protein
MINLKFCIISLLLLMQISCSNQEIQYPTKKIAKSGKYREMTRKEKVVFLIKRNIPRFRTCYYSAKRLHRATRIHGMVTMHFTVNPNGSVQRVGVAESKLPMALKACLVEKVYNIRFPKSKTNRDLKVRQPIRF